LSTAAFKTADAEYILYASDEPAEINPDTGEFTRIFTLKVILTDICSHYIDPETEKVKTRTVFLPDDERLAEFKTDLIPLMQLTSNQKAAYDPSKDHLTYERRDSKATAHAPSFNYLHSIVISNPTLPHAYSLDFRYVLSSMYIPETHNGEVLDGISTLKTEYFKFSCLDSIEVHCGVLFEPDEEHDQFIVFEVSKKLYEIGHAKELTKAEGLPDGDI
jgi:hypothetical protein